MPAESGSRRLVDRYPVGMLVEIMLADARWRSGRVVRHDHPGLWVETEQGSHWFVTNGRHIRPPSGP